jgi:ribosomal protein L11 methyltransferase
MLRTGGFPERSVVAQAHCARRAPARSGRSTAMPRSMKSKGRSVAAGRPGYVRARFAIPAPLFDLFSGALWEAGTMGLEHRELDGGATVEILAYFPAGTSPASVVERIIPWLRVEGGVDLSHTAWETLEDADWNHIWRSCYRPVPIGRRLVVLPSWSRSRFPGRLTVRIKPEMAFGTGSHETTRLCLEALERTALAGRRVADIGTGSGILALAAARLEAREIWACDPDSVALANARYNLRLNGLEARVRLVEGDVRAVPQKPLFDCVVANIVLDPIRDGLVEMAQRLKARGSMYLSGLVAGQERALLPMLSPAGLIEKDRRQMNEWVLLHLEKRTS